MPEMVIRLAILICIGLLTWLLVVLGRRLVDARRQRALAGSPPETLSDLVKTVEGESVARVRILAFSSPDCRQCHQLQQPALERVLEARGESVSVIDIDAPSSPELTQRYQVLTVPTTVILDAEGYAHAVNYGFANTQRLLEQIDEVLSKVAS
jgi:thioredoxin-like negative regulator of GroEL